MRLGGKITAASEVLSDMNARKRPVADALKDWGLSHRFAGSGDRASIGNLVYDVLRKKQSLSWRINDDTPLSLVIAVLLNSWGESAVSLTQKLIDDKFAPKLPEPSKLTHFETSDLTTASPHIQADVPEWTLPHFESMFGTDAIIQCEAQTTRPPVDLRANRILSNREKLLKELPQTIGAIPTLFAQDGIRIPSQGRDYRQPNVQVEPAFQKGFFEIQDEGSQLMVQLCGIKQGDSVLDFCAGGGGKTLALASHLRNKGQVFATDSDKGRLAPIFERLKRAETRNVQVRPAKSDLSDLLGAMDHVVVDAPCTGSGTWRRRPDAKWRLSEAQLNVRVSEQAAILHEAKNYVKKGGFLIYITCSLFHDENTEQIDYFIKLNPNFVSVLTSNFIKNNSPNMEDQHYILHKNGLILTPHNTGTDGFFLSILQQKAWP
jgi:16S rRNA (cytosine967-C5)-methyltransferase